MTADQDFQSNTNDATMSETTPTDAAAPAGVPDYFLSPNAVFSDQGVQWRYGKAPDYSKTRKVWEKGRSMHHKAGSLEEYVENLVKNWEVEASFKPRLSDWRTINHEKYSFAMAGGPPQSAEHMIKVGTYNGIIAPNEYYSPENSDFASSHKTFKRMMPTFAWEVLEVYSPPPRVAFRWRHWGTMKNDYVGFNDKGQKVTAKAHGGQIDIQGLTVARLDEQNQLCDLQNWQDPLDMFRQIAPNGVVNREAMNKKVDMETALDVGPEESSEGKMIIGEENVEAKGEEKDEAMELDEAQLPKHVSESTGVAADAFVPHQGTEIPPTTTTTGEADGQAHPEEMDHDFHDAHESQPLSPSDQQHPLLSCPFTGAQAFASQATAISGDSQAEEKPISFEHPASIGQSASIDHSVSTNHPVLTDDPVSTDHSVSINHPPSNYHEAKSNLSEGQLPASEQQPGDTLPGATHGSPVSPPAQDSTHDQIDAHLEQPADIVHPHEPKAVEEAVQPVPGEAVVAAPESADTEAAKEEMSSAEGLMNRE